MYNGIGLKTARGSGTNGYVQRNLSYVRSSNIRALKARNTGNEGYTIKPAAKKPNKEILEHERKRQIEVKVFEKRVELEDRGISEQDVELQLQTYREKIESEMCSNKTSFSKSSHARVMRKEEEIQRLQDAFGISQDFVEGGSFNPDLVEERRQERLAERAKNDEPDDVRMERLERERKEYQEERRKRSQEVATTFQRRDGTIEDIETRMQRLEKERQEYQAQRLERQKNSSRSRSRDRNRSRFQSRSRSRKRSRSRSRSRRSSRSSSFSSDSSRSSRRDSRSRSRGRRRRRSYSSSSSRSSSRSRSRSSSRSRR